MFRRQTKTQTNISEYGYINIKIIEKKVGRLKKVILEFRNSVKNLEFM